MLEEGLIEDQSFQVSLAPVGGVVFASYSEVRVYKGEYEDYSYRDYYYFQRYQPEISETLTAELSEKTISAVLDYLAATFPGENAG